MEKAAKMRGYSTIIVAIGTITAFDSPQRSLKRTGGQSHKQLEVSHSQLVAQYLMRRAGVSIVTRATAILVIILQF